MTKSMEHIYQSKDSLKPLLVYLNKTFKNQRCEKIT
jgi:hypothetical protein